VTTTTSRRPRQRGEVSRLLSRCRRHRIRVPRSDAPALQARGRGERDKRDPNSCGWALSTAAPRQRQRLLSAAAASSRRGNSYMSSLTLVITIARCNVGGGGCGCGSAMEGGGVGASMVGWGGAQKLSDDNNYHWGRCPTPKKHPPKIQNAPKFEKDLNENILSRKRENHTETLGRGMWRI